MAGSARTTAGPFAPALKGAPVAHRAARRGLVVSASGKGGGERQPWEFGRFLQTIFWFNPPPTPDKVLRTLAEQPGNILRSLAGPAMEAGKQAVVTLIAPRGAAPAGADRGVVLVTGATGGVGKRVVAQLLRRGRRVRALVRDADKGRALLGGLEAAPGASLELAAADLTQISTLLPEMFAGVVAVVGCSAVKVAPKEGDTVDRAKYYQGIKFYDPEIVGDTPETVEYVGMANLMAAVREQLGQERGATVYRAGDAASPVQQWGPLDDVVMGGASQSTLAVRQGAGEAGRPAGVFGGRVTEANNGGFASVRTRTLDPPLNLSAYAGLELRLRGDGQRYKLIVRPDPAWDGIGYTASFDTVAGEWQTVRLPFSSFAPVFRARTVRDAPPLDASAVSSLQLMISKFEYDGGLNPSFRPGQFELPLESVTAYMAQPVAPRFVLVSSAGVTRPNRPGIDVEQEPPAVKMNDALGGILTFKLKGEDVLRESGVPYAVVRPVALTEEPVGAELQLDQGDTIKGKISREEVAELCVELLERPEALDTTFEIKSTVPFSQPWQVDPANPPPPRDWAALLGGAGLQKRVTGKTVGGVYTGREPEPQA